MSVILCAQKDEARVDDIDGVFSDEVFDDTCTTSIKPIYSNNCGHAAMKSAAIAYIGYGLSAVPAIKADKRPAGKWKDYQRRLPTEADFASWSGDAVCVITGAVSGNLLMIDFDQQAKAYPQWAAKIPSDLLARCVTERSQRGGIHVVVRSECEVGKNTRLALDADGKVLIETRGEGGLFLCAPTEGYTLTQGDFASIPVLTADEVETLLSAARELNVAKSKPAAQPKLAPTPQPPRWSHTRPDAVERCRRYVATMDASVAGNGGDAALWRATLAIFHDFALDETDGRPILDDFNSRCQPPWGESVLQHKIRDALDPAYPKDKPRGWRLDEQSTTQSATVTQSREWQPITLYKNPERIGDFPTEALSPWQRRWVEVTSNNLQTPAAMLAMESLGVLSGCLAKRVVVVARYGWSEPINLYVCALMSSANRKSAILGAAMKPINELDAQLHKEGLVERNKVLAERDQIKAENKTKAKSAKEKAKNDSALTTESTFAEIVEACEDATIPLPPIPPIPQLKCDDITEEALAVSLVNNGQRIISTSAEASSAFVNILGKYGGGVRSSLYLKGHDINDSHRVDRQNKNEPILLDGDFTLTCLYAGQQSTLEEVSRDNLHLKNSGLFARFLWVVPQSNVGYRKTGSGHIIEDKASDAFYHDRITQLAKAMRGEAELIKLSLSPDARKLFEKWEAEIEVMLRPRGRLGIDDALCSWGGKLAGETLRLAGNLHCGDLIGNIAAIKKSKRIAGGTMGRAITIADHTIAHASAFFVGVLDGHDGRSDARHLARWIVRTKSERFTKSHAQQQCKNRFKKAEDIDPALAELERHHCIRPIGDIQERCGAGRPPSQEYETNPDMFRTANADEVGLAVA